MRAHTIPTKARVGGRERTKRTIVPGGIIALSLAVVLLGPTASTASAERGPTASLTGNGVTTPTPPIPPLTLSVRTHGELEALLALCGSHKRLPFFATASNDSTLVARGDVKKTKRQLAAGETTKIEAKFKHPKRLKEKPGRPEVEVEVKATDEFGQTATKVLNPPQASRCPR